MRSFIQFLFVVMPLSIMSCSDDKAEKKQVADTDPTATSPAPEGKGNAGTGLIGEWEQLKTCYDKNNNAQLEPEERLPATPMLGFNYFRFNKDGTCFYDKEIAFAGKYEIKETPERKNLLIFTKDGSPTGIKYTIKGEITNELLLYNEGVFLIYKRK